MFEQSCRSGGVTRAPGSVTTATATGIDVSHPQYGPPQAQQQVSLQKGAGTPPPSPWYKKPWAIVLGVLLAIGLIGSAVNGGKDESASSTVAAPSSSTAVQSPSAAPPPSTQAVAPPPATTPPPTAPAPVAVSFTMPDFVGMDLQSAQNLVQTFGPFLSLSHDLLGSRNQMVDSGWIVCDQNIAPGQQVTGDAEGLIDFGVVKREEFCP
jgi:hypothetical protein